MKTYTLEDIKEAFESGYYEGAGDDAWYSDYDSNGHLTRDARVHRPMQEYLESSYDFSDSNG